MSLGIFLIFVIALCFAAVFGLFKLRPNQQVVRVVSAVTRKPTESFVSTVRAVAWCGVAPTVVMAVFVAFSGSAIREWERFVSIQKPIPPDLTQSANPVIPVDQPGNGSLQKSDLVENRPEWIAEGDHAFGDGRRVVLASKLWSTESEAMHELQAQTAALICNDFQQRHQGLFDPDVEPFLDNGRAIKAAVMERYLERIDQDFGNFSSPMNRVWWQVEISPSVRTEIYPSWKKAVIENRIIAVGVILSILTMAANVTALFARLSRAPNGGFVRAVAVSGICAAAWVAADLLIASRLLS